MGEVGVGRRAVAILIDWILSSVWTLPFTDVQRSPGYTHIELTGAPFLAVVAIWLAYFTVMETLFGGTIGKLVTGIRVVREDGGRIDIGAALIRTLARIVDGFPYVLPYLVGAISVWGSPRRQRLGDRWARTVVVPASAVATGAHAPGLGGSAPLPVPGPPAPAAPPPMPPPPPVRSDEPVVIPDPVPADPPPSPSQEPDGPRWSAPGSDGPTAAPNGSEPVPPASPPEDEPGS